MWDGDTWMSSYRIMMCLWIGICLRASEPRRFSHSAPNPNTQGNWLLWRQWYLPAHITSNHPVASRFIWDQHMMKSRNVHWQARPWKTSPAMYGTCLCQCRETVRMTSKETQPFPWPVTESSESLSFFVALNPFWKLKETSRPLVKKNTMRL